MVLNYGQGDQLPVDRKTGLTQVPRFEVDLLGVSRVDILAPSLEFLFDYAKFFEPPKELKSDGVPVDLAFQFDLDFKSHRHICASASEILRLHQIAHAVRASSDLL